MKKSNSLPASSLSIGSFYALLIPDEMAKLKRVLKIVERWELFSDAELKKLKHEVAQKEKNAMADQHGYDPVNDEAFMLHQTSQIMYANLAVTIAASTETFVDRFCQAKQIGYKNNKGEGIKRPDWGCKKTALQGALNVKFEDLDGFETNQKARIMANCFKHNDCRSSSDFVKKYGGCVGDEIKYECEDWGGIIDDTSAFLQALAGML